MCFFASLMPATMLTVIGFIVLFCASKSGGGLQIFGRILAVWLFLIAAFVPLMGLYVALSGICPLDQIMQNPTP